MIYYTTLKFAGTNLTIPLLKDRGYVLIDNELQVSNRILIEVEFGDFILPLEQLLLNQLIKVSWLNNFVSDKKSSFSFNLKVKTFYSFRICSQGSQGSMKFLGSAGKQI